jgi:hypothetical protein
VVLKAELRPEDERTNKMRKKILAGVAAGALAAMGIAAPANAISDTSADLYVLHAVPGLIVDVYVDGSLTLDDFEPGDLTDAIDLPAGTYTVAITGAEAADASAPVIPAFDITLGANMSYTAVAHLDASGAATATFYTNDLSAIAAGQGKITIRHTAAAPTVDILAAGATHFANLSNGGEVKHDMGVGTISAAVALTGTLVPVIGPADVTVAEGSNVIVYAWGSAQAGNLALAVQVIDGLQTSPTGVPAGSAGLAADGNNVALIGGFGALAALLALLGVAATRLRTARAQK